MSSLLRKVSRSWQGGVATSRSSNGLPASVDLGNFHGWEYMYRTCEVEMNLPVLLNKKFLPTPAFACAPPKHFKDSISDGSNNAFLVVASEFSRGGGWPWWLPQPKPQRRKKPRSSKPETFIDKFSVLAYIFFGEDESQRGALTWCDNCTWKHQGPGTGTLAVVDQNLFKNVSHLRARQRAWWLASVVGGGLTLDPSWWMRYHTWWCAPSEIERVGNKIVKW
jgi:hypothetical protein